MGVFVHDLQSEDTFHVKLPHPVEGNFLSPIAIKISGNGRFIAIDSVTNDGSQTLDDPHIMKETFLHDLLNDATNQIPINSISEDLHHSPVLPTLSWDGRFTVIPSLKPDPNSRENSNRDAFSIYDRVTDHIYKISAPKLNQPGFAGSLKTKISDVGRTIVYQLDMYPGILGYYNRVTTDNRLIDFSTQNGDLNILDFDISETGNTLVYIAQSNDPITNNEVNGIYLYEVEKAKNSFVKFLEINQLDQVSISLTGDGGQLALQYSSKDNEGVILLLDMETGSEIPVDLGIIGPHMDLSHDGTRLVYTKMVDGISQVFLWEASMEGIQSYLLAGRVTDLTGNPLALVTIRNDRGDEIRTDANGYFWFNGIRPGGIVLRPTKEGFRFDPTQNNIDMVRDIKDVYFISEHDESLKEAKKDLGMPYSFNRGQSGLYHGYSAGYCTDLVLDAYTWGVDFNIQFALEQDFRANPWHFYRWRDARNAHDMWRYFSYSGQIQPHENPYLPGDIVFFDWSEDGEIDHVAVVSEVNSKNRPRLMYDATGVIDSNPGGLAAELPWEYFHEQTVRGFARWSGKYEPIIQNLPLDQVLQIGLGGAGVDVRLLDPDGNVISNQEVSIEGGRFDDWIWEQTISLERKIPYGSFYLVVLFNPTDQILPYKFTAQFIENGLINSRVETGGNLTPGEIKRFPLILNLDTNEAIILEPRNSNRRIEGILK
jgi:hypothetical protein